MSATHDAALRYAARGWKVFTLAPGAKVPASKNVTYRVATSDPATINAWFLMEPESNLAIQPAASGFVVFDVDSKNGGLETLSALEAKHGRIQTLSATTPTGGKHFLFNLPQGIELSNRLGIAPGCDFIADKNHIVAAPSVTERGEYRWDDEAAAIAPLPAWLLELVAPKPVVEAPASSLPAIEGVKGRLAASTLKFFNEGAPKGQWNHTLHKAARDAHQQGYSQEWFINEAKRPTGYLDSKDLATIESAFATEPKHPPRIDPMEAVRKLILQCTMVTNLADLMETRMVDLKDGVEYQIDPKMLDFALDSDERESYRAKNRVFAQFIYNPHVTKPISVDSKTSLYVYNTYVPPTWKADLYYRDVPLTAVATLPPLYEEFFTHLTAGDGPSKEFLLDWLANSLRARNFTILTAIGEQGIGKGTLASILKTLHGDTNFSEATDNVFKAKFNGKLENKTLVYVDEIDLKTKESQDRIKAVVNDNIEIEKKGIDATTVTNHANFYISSNSFDAIRIEAGDRRFSVIQLTDTKLTETPLIKRVTELADPANVAELARYLMGRTITNNMLRPFRSKRFEEVREAGLGEWELYLLECLLPKYAGAAPLMSEIQDEVATSLNLKNPPGRKKLMELSKKYPEAFRLVRGSGNHPYKLVVPAGFKGPTAA